MPVPEGPDVLVIEDIRTFRFPAVYARNMQEAWTLLHSRRWSEIWFDHDMGLTVNDNNTYPLAVHLERLAFEGTPLDVGRIVVHTANPSGGQRLMAALRAYNPVRVVANDYLAEGSPILVFTRGTGE